MLVTGTTGCGQVDDARRDDRAHQRDGRASTSSRSRTRSSTCTGTTSSRDRPARGRQRHRLLRDRAPPRAAPGPGRDPDRRDARRDDGPHRARGRRDGAPGPLDGPHARRARDDQPDPRLLPARRSISRRARCSPGRSRASSPSGSCRDPTGMGRIAITEILHDDRARPRPDPRPQAHRRAART